jgi:hypothetical protein
MKPLKQLSVAAALGAVLFALSGCASYPSHSYRSSYGELYDPGYGAGYPGGYIDGTLAPYGRVYRDEERRRDWRNHRRDERDPRGTTRPDRDRYTAPGGQYQRPYGPDRDPDDERFAPGGRP